LFNMADALARFDYHTEEYLELVVLLLEKYQ
jgi:hypothetical protein